MPKTFKWKQYFAKRISVFQLHWVRQISYPVIIVAGMVVIYSIIKPEAAIVLNVSFWGSFFVVSFGVFIFIFIFSLTSWGRTILNKMPWEAEYRKQEKAKRQLERRLRSVETRLDNIDTALRNLIGGNYYGKKQPNTKTKSKEGRRTN